jgi:hypothetical protein
MLSDDPLGELRRRRASAEGDGRLDDEPDGSANRNSSLGGSRRRRRHLSDDEAVRLLDAAMAVLGATGALVRVGEDILRERRDAIGGSSGHWSTGEPPDDDGDGRIDLSY